MFDLQENKITNISDAEAASPTMGFEFRKKAGNKEQQAKSKQPKLTSEDLRNDARLLAWFRSETEKRHPAIKDCEANLLNVFAAAERALEHGESPPALFVHVVNGRQWHLITDHQDERARQRLRRLRNPGRDTQRRQDEDHERQPEPCSVGNALRDVLQKRFGMNCVPLLADHSEDL